MILRTTSPVPVADLLKALSARADTGGVGEKPAAAAPAPAAPHASSGGHNAPSGGGGGHSAAAPSGAEQRKVGGKYVKRWWDNGRWNYDYGDGGAKPHHPASFGAHEDKKREHALPLPEGHQPHPQGPEADYHHALAGTFSPGAVHQVPHPSPHNQGEHVVVSSQPGGKINVRSAGGMNRTFNTHGDYEKWHREEQGGARVYHDPQGQPFAHVTPKVGEVRHGKLQPREETGSPGQKKKAWVINYNAQHPNAPGAGNRGHAQSREDAEKQLNQQFTNIQRFAGGATDKIQNPQAGGHRSRANIDDVESKLSWKLGTAGARKNKPVLNVTPEQREQLIQQVGNLYMPFLARRAQQMVEGRAAATPVLNDPSMRKDAVQELVGFDPMAPRDNDVAAIQPDSILHRTIGYALDNYNPNQVGKQGTRIGLKEYLTHDNGSLVNALRKDFDRRVLPLFQQRQLGLGATGEGGGGTATGGESDRTGGTAGERAAAQRAVTQSTPESELEAQQEAAASSPHTTELTTTDPAVWRQRQQLNMASLADENPHISPDLVDYITTNISQINTPVGIGDAIGKLNKLDQKYPLAGGKRWSDYVADFGKGLHFAAALLHEEMAKATGGFVMRDKGVDPTHTYSHREGTEDHPRYYFRTQNGDYVRYTNAPGGHADASKFNGDPAVHFAEPSAGKAPQFFSPDGRKLTRAPAQGIDIQWNRNYHPQDPENLWYGRWVEPSTGEHAYTYLDADIRGIPELLIHQQNALTDVRIPVLRSYVARLSTSPHLKDRVTALGLALVDQGRMRLQELGALKVADVYEEDSLWCLGNRYIYADRRTRGLLTLLTRARHPEEPFLAVPLVKMDGDLDTDKIRIIGPHYLEGILEQIGLSAAALQVYHATQTFSREVQRILYEGCTPWEIACAYATAQVAAEMGYDLREQMDLEQALPLVRELLIDPVVVEVLERNANQNKLCDGDPRLLDLPGRPVSYVSLDLNTRTADEQDFSAWLHAYPVHRHARVALQQAQAQPDAPSVRM